MKRILFITLISLIVVSFNVSAGETVAPAPKVEIQSTSNVLHGFVCDKLTQETLAGAVITANGQKIYSDLDGNFELSNLCGEKCQIKVSSISYVDQTIEIDTRSTKQIQVKLQQR